MGARLIEDDWNRAVAGLRGDRDIAVTVVARPGKRLVDDDLGVVADQGLEHPYFDGWRARGRDTVAAVRRSVRRCPDAAVVVGGHSEGAVAAHAALRTLSRSRYAAERRHVAGVWLLGDPLRTSEDADDPYGQDDTGGHLEGRGPALPGWVRRQGLLTSACRTDDLICYDPYDDPTAGHVDGHYRYDASSVAGAASRLPAAEKVVVPAISKARIDVAVNPRELVGGVRLSTARRLPKGLHLRDGRLVGTAPKGRTKVRLWVRGRSVAPAVRRPVTVVIDAQEQAAARGTVLVSEGIDGRPANGEQRGAVVSADGTTVAYGSSATNLVKRRVSEGHHGYVWDARRGRTELVSVDADGRPLVTYSVQLSADGRVALFADGQGRVWRRDRDAGTSAIVPGAKNGVLSADGRMVTFVDGATARRWHADTGVVEDLGVQGLQATSPNGRYLALLQGNDLSIWDTTTGSTVSTVFFPLDPTCSQSIGWVSDDGRYVLSSEGCGHGEGWTTLSEVAGLRAIVGEHVVNASRDGQWSVRLDYDGTATLRSTASGTGRTILRTPRWLSQDDDDFDYDASASVADGGRAVAYAHLGVDVVPGAYGEGVRQIYYWNAR